MTIIEQAREWLVRYDSTAYGGTVSLDVSVDDFAALCRALIQRTEALRELANATERLAMTDDKSALRRACMAIDDARRALADD